MSTCGYLKCLPKQLVPPVPAVEPVESVQPVTSLVVECLPTECGVGIDSQDRPSFPSSLLVLELPLSFDGNVNLTHTTQSVQDVHSMPIPHSWGLTRH